MKKRFLLLPFLALVLTSCDYLDMGQLLSRSTNEDNSISQNEEGEPPRTGDDDTSDPDVSEPVIDDTTEPDEDGRNVYGSDMPVLDPFETWGFLHEYEFKTSSYHSGENQYTDTQKIKLYTDGGKLEMTTTYEGDEQSTFGYFYHEAPNTAYMVMDDEESITAWQEDEEHEIFFYMLEEINYMSARSINQAMMFYENLSQLSDDEAIATLLVEEDMDSLEISRRGNVFTFIFRISEEDGVTENEIKIGFTNNKITLLEFNEKYYVDDELVMDDGAIIELVFLPTLPMYDGPRIAFEGEQTLYDLIFGGSSPSSELVGSDLPEIRMYEDWEDVSAISFYFTNRDAIDQLDIEVRTMSFDFYENYASSFVSTYDKHSYHSNSSEARFEDGYSNLYIYEDGELLENTITPGSSIYEQFVADLNTRINQLLNETLSMYRAVTVLSSRSEMEEFTDDIDMDIFYIYHYENEYTIVLEKYSPGTSLVSDKEVFIESSIAMQIIADDGMFSYFSYRIDWYEDGNEVISAYYDIDVTFAE